LVQRLKNNGVENSYALRGGTDAWVRAGYPMEKSERKAQ
jgi:rhodanese-related sulfurtransferase